jgi:RHS repeat-associated protein
LNLKTIYSESYITDNMGNVRATFRINASGQAQLLQTFDYYPFGLRVKGGVDITYPNEFMYQGKELDNENGLNWYDFHARMYDPILGRWHTPDPAQQYVSPYMAMGNDPVNRVDPNGMEDGGLKGWLWTLFHLRQRIHHTHSGNYSYGDGGDGGATYNDWESGHSLEARQCTVEVVVEVVVVVLRILNPVNIGVVGVMGWL